MRAKQSLITRVIVAAVATGSIATGIAVPLLSAAAPGSATVASQMTSDIMVHD